MREVDRKTNKARTQSAPRSADFTAAGHADTDSVQISEKGTRESDLTRPEPPQGATTDHNNVYLQVPLPRVRVDALYGVRAAREAWRARDPEGAAKILGRIIEPGQEHELMRCNRPQLTSVATGPDANARGDGLL